MKKYDHKKIEKKWQKNWQTKESSRARDFGQNKKQYVLVEFPFPSGAGLHMGHLRPYVAGDVYSRFSRMSGANVLYPIGWDAFGLPAENFAIKNKVHPKVSTAKNIKNAKKQLLSWGISFDWTREINTSDPKYYKWTQWIFLQLFKKGLAYEATGLINWCPKDKTGLANEEVLDGKCERCGTTVEKKELRQWYLKITAYAEKLLAGLENLNWPKEIKIQQENWIDRSEGALIKFPLGGLAAKWQLSRQVEVFTTRPDTIFGATYLVLAPEHSFIENCKLKIENWNEVQNYIEESKKKSDIQRSALEKEKTGVELRGVIAINPADKKEIPIWIADYVLGGYGTGAIMAVPAHDERDFEFAKKYGLPLKTVIEPVTGKVMPNEQLRKSIVAIVEDTKTKKFLTLDWGSKLGGTLFIGGGREEGEDVVDTALREIKEETGYTNLSFVGKTENMHHHYFAFSKNVARNIEVVGLHFKLTGDEKINTNHQEDEKGNFAVEWLSQEEILKRMEDENHLLNFRRLILGEVYTGEGILTNSGKFDGMDSQKTKSEITKFVGGKTKIQYKLRDWAFSRQRYWGEPIPVVHCKECALRDPSGQGVVAVPEEDLPVKLPNVKNYEPTGTGESPLAAIDSWVNTKCPNCKGPAKRETNTMPQWAGSSWYYLRYLDPNNDDNFADEKLLKYWLPVDIYFGGREHTTLHLLYSRFWHLFLYDQKLVPTPEPYAKRVPHGIILGPDGEKMSKSRGNVVSPDDVVEQFGADALRMYEMFLGPHESTVSWKTEGIVGIKRFLDRAWKLFSSNLPISSRLNPPSSTRGAPTPTQKLEDSIQKSIHKTVKKITEDIENFRFNTTISALMILLNEMEKAQNVEHSVLNIFLRLLSPFAPHISDELWSLLGNKNSISLEKWPEYDPKLIEDETFELIVQINGKIRDSFEVPIGILEEEATKLALAKEKIKAILGLEKPKKIIFVPTRLINIVI